MWEVSPASDTLSRVDWPYIAGFFDGEGCVSRDRNGRPVCTVTQTDGDHFVIEKIQKFLKDNGIAAPVQSYDKGPRTKSHKRLCVSGACSVEDFLSNILPFLIVKKDKATAALELVRGAGRTRWARESSVESAAREYEKGILSLQQAEAKYGISRRRMLRKLHELGIRKRHRWENGTWRDSKGKFKLTRHHAEIIKSMPLVLFHVSDVAALLDCHPDTIRLMRSGKTWRSI